MKLISLITIFCVFIKINDGELEIDTSLIHKIISDIIEIVYDIPYFKKVTCDEVNKTLISYFLYTPANKNNPIVLTEGAKKNLKTFNPKLETKLLIHGWVATANDSWLLSAKDAYFERGNYNVIILNWGKYALDFYSKSVCYVKKVANVTANLIIQVQDEAHLDLSKTHIIGHSMGAQMAGIIGQYIQKITGGQKIYRVTALDAAGPLYCYPNLDEDDERVTLDDAYFVDGIHTNGGELGCGETYGDVDFYPNCGKNQYGCNSNDMIFSNFTGSIETIIDQLPCSHLRAPLYWIESIKSSKFVSAKCTSCIKFFFKICRLFDEEIMGEDCSSSATGKYYLRTKTTFPFAVNSNN